MPKPQLPESWVKHDDSVRPYLRAHRAIGWGRRGVGLFFLGVLLFRGGAYWAQDIAFSLSRGFLGTLIFFALVGAVTEGLQIPFGLMGHGVERRFGLSKQSYASWLWDRMKGWMVGGVLGAVALGVFYVAPRLWREGWWITTAGFLVLFSVLLAQLAPVLLMPLFFKLSPFEPGPLRDRLLALCGRFGLAVKEVYHWGMSDKTEKGNAAFTGIGPTKRILIGDTLYRRFPPDQVEAVFAHELGHQVNHDLWKGIGFSVVTLFLSFGISNVVMMRWVEPYFDVALETPFGLLLFFVVLSLVQAPLGVLSAGYSRSRERAADRFAADVIQVGKPLGDALEALTIQNRGLFYPAPWREWLFYSHPAPWRRIQTLRGKLT